MAIDAELDTVDNLPNYQMLVGQPIGTDMRPEKLKANNGVSFSMSKVKRCDEYLAKFADDEALVRAYQAKRAKELIAAERLFSRESMIDAYSKAGAACALLETTLPERDPHPDLYVTLGVFLEQLDQDRSWLEAYVRFELALLAELGFGLDLSRCAVTGTSDDLAYV